MSRGRERQPGDQSVVDEDRRPPGDRRRLVLEPRFEHPRGASGSFERRLDVFFRHAMSLAQVGRPLGTHRAEA